MDQAPTTNLEELRIKMLKFRELREKNGDPDFVINRVDKDLQEYNEALGTIEHMLFVYGNLPIETGTIDLDDED